MTTNQQKGTIMVQFSTTRLVGDRVLVQGRDQFGTDGSTVLDAAQWYEVNAHKQVDVATEEFSKAVEEFFKPLTDAADKLNAAQPVPDPIGYVVLSEAVEGVPAAPAHVIGLSKDSIVLRLLEQGDHDRLAWVNDVLEVLEVLPVTPGTSLSDVAAAQQEQDAQAERVFTDGQG